MAKLPRSIVQFDPGLLGLRGGEARQLSSILYTNVTESSHCITGTSTTVLLSFRLLQTWIRGCRPAYLWPSVGKYILEVCGLSAPGLKSNPFVSLVCCSNMSFRLALELVPQLLPLSHRNRARRPRHGLPGLCGILQGKVRRTSGRQSSTKA